MLSRGGVLGRSCQDAGAGTLRQGGDILWPGRGPPDLAPLSRQPPPITCPGTWPPAPPTRTCTRLTSSAATPTRRLWRTARQSSTTTSPRSRCTTTRPPPWPSAPTCCGACHPASLRWRSTTLPALEVGGPGGPGWAGGPAPSGIGRAPGAPGLAWECRGPVRVALPRRLECGHLGGQGDVATHPLVAAVCVLWARGCA